MTHKVNQEIKFFTTYLIHFTEPEMCFIHSAAKGGQDIIFQVFTGIYEAFIFFNNIPAPQVCMNILTEYVFIQHVNRCITQACDPGQVLTD